MAHGVWCMAIQFSMTIIYDIIFNNYLLLIGYDGDAMVLICIRCRNLCRSPFDRLIDRCVTMIVWSTGPNSCI